MARSYSAAKRSATRWPFGVEAVHLETPLIRGLAGVWRTRVLYVSGLAVAGGVVSTSVQTITHTLTPYFGSIEAWRPPGVRNARRKR